MTKSRIMIFPEFKNIHIIDSIREKYEKSIIEHEINIDEAIKTP